MLIRDIIEIYSPTGSEDELVDFLVEWAKKNGFEAYKDEVGNFVAGKGSGREVLLVGHVDTVPGEIPVRMKGRKLYGRGAVDAKGSLACFLEAAVAVDKGRTIVVGAVDEEGASKGARNVLDKFAPAFIIIGEPSGWNNLNIGYKGRVILVYMNEKSKEHSSSSSLNCHEEAIEFFNKIKNFGDFFNQEKKLFDQLGIKLLSINSNDNGFTEHSEMAINFRIPVGFELDRLKDFVEENKGRASISYSPFEEPVKVDKRNKLISAFIRAIRSVNGNVTFKLKAGTSDMNILQKYNVPMVTYGPGDSSLDHTPYECLDLDEYEKAVDIVKTVLEKI